MKRITKDKLSSTRNATLLAALLLSGLQICAQDGSQGLIPDIPPSPQAAAFNRLGDYQMSNNYGMPDISIPLFEIDFHGYRIPLVLHYEASPLKPGYNYDVTGVGWTLSGNSCVSRTIKDRADEWGRFNNPFELDPFYDISGQPKRYMDYDDELDLMNFQYDNYNIVLPSGRTIPFFMYKWDGVMQYQLMSLDSNVKITCSYGINSIDSFAVKDENGVTYHFTLPEKATNIYQNDPTADRNVTWLLTSIDIPARGTIAYEYTGLQTINTSTVSEPVIRVSRLVSEMPEDVTERRFNVMKTLQSQSPRYEMRFLRRISYGPSRVCFNYMPDGCHMKDIVVTDGNDTIRTFTLNVSGSSSYPGHLNTLVIAGRNSEDRLSYGFTYYNYNPGDYTDYWGNRCEAGPSVNAGNGQSMNNHGLNNLGNFNLFFDYDGIGVDSATIQNRLNDEGMLAQLIGKKPDDHSYYYKLKLQSTTDGDTRVPGTPDKHGVLTSIIYPNGGHTTFNWENHRFPTATAADGDFVFDRRSQRIIEGGGFRIESVINWTAEGEIASKDFYRYGFTLGDIIHRNFPLPIPDSLSLTDTLNHHIGCGEAVVDPNLLTFMSFSHATLIGAPLEFQKMAVGLPSAFSNITNNQGKAAWWDAYFSTNTFRALLGGRRPVVYPEITVYHGHPYEPSECKGKTVYKYNIYDCQLSNINYYLSAFNQTTLPDTAYFEPVYYLLYNTYNDRQGVCLRSMENPAKRHQLKSKSDYSYDATGGMWELVSEETYSYDVENISKSDFIFSSEVSRGHCGHHTLQLGANRPLEYFYLQDFYKPSTQKFGRSTLSGKNTTFLRQGGTRTDDNVHKEVYSYLYAGVQKYRDYTDLYYNVRIQNSCEDFDKRDIYCYAGEEENDSVISEMKSRNMLASVTRAETLTDVAWPSVLSGRKIEYGFFGNDILPRRLYDSDGEQYEESAEVLSYDSFGNPTEIVDLKTGMHSVFIWDGYGRYMLAMARNATLSQVGNVQQLLSGTSVTRHAALKTLLPDAMVETWDYLPLTGVSAHTDASGQTVLYEYDGLGRLKTEKRVVNGTADPEILREYEYDYLNPQY